MVLSVLAGVCFIKMRPIIISYAESQAETILLNASNEAILSILRDSNTSYDDIIILSKDSGGYVTSLEVNIVKINMLKSLISSKTSEIVAKNEHYTISIPAGTFFGSEYIAGMGPKIHFKMQITSTSVVDFEHEFTSSGINQVLHKIIINMDTKGSIIMSGYSGGFSVSTTAIAAQTVIVGAAPDAFTNVIESDSSDTGGLINDYGAY